MKTFLKKSALILLILIVLCLLSIQSIAIASTEISSDITSSEILKKVENKYLSAKTYKDEGTVKCDLGNIEFETYFSKPSSFLFKWNMKLLWPSHNSNKKQIISTHFALQSYKNETYIYLYYKDILNKEVDKYLDVKDAIYAATGISWTSALYIPSYFFPGLNEWKLTDIDIPKIIGIQKVGNKKCYQIVGKRLSKNTEYELWVEKDTYIIRKLIVDKSDTYIFNEVSVDENIPDNIFEFVPNSYF